VKVCKICKVNKATSIGGGKFHSLCSSCKDKPWARYKKDDCECCGFKPTHPCQLDVDHIDGSKSNNSPSNLQTLCANCHRLKTHLNGDYATEKKVDGNQGGMVLSLF
jgi:hypothetical protein